MIKIYIQTPKRSYDAEVQVVPSIGESVSVGMANYKVVDVRRTIADRYTESSITVIVE
jgi:hypothetical protein